MKAVPWLLRLLRSPFSLIALATGAKSFVDNPILGSARLNRLGLHSGRVRVAHAMARFRRSRLKGGLPDELRASFERDGFVVVHDLLPTEQFEQLRDALLTQESDCSFQQQGDTVTRRVAVGPALRRQVPHLDGLLRSRHWRGILAYVATNRSAPLYYVQTISGGIAHGPPDPQLELHADTFHPSLKAWLFLTDVGEDDRPLTYVAGSHRLTDARIAWERDKSVAILEEPNPLSKRGSLRVGLDELEALGLPAPTRFCVPANTLVAIDTCGFHARAQSGKASVRVELWAYCRRNPFLPWTWGGLLSLRPIAERQAQLLAALLDRLDRLGLRKNHWKPGGRKRPVDP